MTYVRPDVRREPVEAPAQPALRSVLVPLARGDGAGRVLGRVALLPFARGARITLLHVRTRLEGAGDGRLLLSESAAALVSMLPRTIRVDAGLASGSVVGGICDAADAMHADLVVMGAAEHPVRKLVMGATAPRVARYGKRPVLIARQAAPVPYMRPVLAIDIDESAREVLGFARRIVQSPTTAVVHVYDAPFAGIIHPSPSDRVARAHREDCKRDAERSVRQLLATASTGGHEIHLYFGEPRLVIPAATQELGADLLALGTHARSIVGHALLGSVASDVADRVRCDVLVVPPVKGRRGAG